jgi:hypothetical protein
MAMSQAARQWRMRIEECTSKRLRQLQQRGLWNGVPPVPVDHVAEHLLNLEYSWEVIEEEEGEEVLGSLRPPTREIVLNERHRERFSVMGCLRFTIGHECGHADLYALADLATEQGLLLPQDARTYEPKRARSTNGEVEVLVRRMNDALRGASRERRRDIYEHLLEEERRRIEAGQDTALEAAAVNHYASSLLMPADLMREAVRGIELIHWQTLSRVAAQFEVSKEALKHRLNWLGLLHVLDDGSVSQRNPVHQGQGELF